MPVIERRLPAGLNGQWRPDDDGGEILINAAAPNVQKHLTLLHELIHITEEKLVQGNLLSRRSGERRVGHFAATLFGILATSGLWKSVPPGEAARFYARRKGRLREGLSPLNAGAASLKPPAKVAWNMVREGRDKVGWYVSVANSASKRQATHWNIVSCASEAEARAHARMIRRAIVDGIRVSRTPA